MTQSINPFTDTNTVPNEQNVDNLQGFIRTLSEDPSSSGILQNPKKFVDQVVQVTNGGSTSAYFYDTKNQAWNYTKVFDNSDDMLRREEEVPTDTPTNRFDQIVLVTNGGSTRTYFYEPVATTWRYTQLT